MSYCAMNGVEVNVPERALRPREPAPPSPSVTMASPLVAKRMLRPRTKAEKAMTGVDVKACLAAIKDCKKQQRAYEKRLKELVEKLNRVLASNPGSKDVRDLQKMIDSLLACIKNIAAKANQYAMDAIKGGASQDDVRVAAGDAPIERTPVAAPPAAPVIETNTPAVLPDGSVVPGSDAKVTTPETGKPVEPEKEGKAGAESESSGMGILPMLAIAGGAWWLWSRMKKA